MGGVARFREVFRCSRAAVIGMVHVKPLPGTPLHRHSVEQLVAMARQEAFAYAEADVDGVVVENMFDVPYVRGSSLGPEVTAVMTRVANEVRQVLPPHIPCGVQVLAGGNEEALAISKACGLQFIRAECFVFSHVADEGLMNACAGPLLRYRRAIGAEDVMVFTDIKKKHSAHALTQDVSVGDMAAAAQFFLADGVILTGSATGQQADPAQLHEVLGRAELPVLVGSGVTQDNVHHYMQAHGLIVGSHFKTNNSWQGDLDIEKIKSFTALVKNLRGD